MTCEELEQQRIQFQAEYDAAMTLLQAAQALPENTPEEMAVKMAFIAAAQSLLAAATQNLMYNYWNRYMLGCIQGMQALSDAEQKTGHVMMTPTRLAELAKLNPRMAKLLELYMSED